MPVIKLVAGSGDLLRCRFATSPLWETANAVRAFVDPRSRPYLRPWWAAVRDRRPGPDLLAVQAVHGYIPDFLSQPPVEAAPRVEDQLGAVRATSPERVAAELGRVDRARSVLPGVLDAMRADPAAARDRLVAQLEEAWRLLVLPWWPRVRELIDADVAYRSRLLAAYGLGHVVGSLHERIRWDGAAVVVEPAHEDIERELGGDGLILMPSAFVWPSVTAIVDRPWRPTLVYPARGIGELLGGRAAASAPLARLLGRTRALILTDLAEPATTAALAARHGLRPSTVSAHLSALHGAGLLTRRRHGHEVHYRRTPLGQALTEGVMPGE
jgi:DNA-binding transcriptional ArsR family regulator